MVDIRRVRSVSERQALRVGELSNYYLSDYELAEYSYCWWWALSLGDGDSRVSMFVAGAVAGTLMEATGGAVTGSGLTPISSPRK